MHLRQTVSGSDQSTFLNNFHYNYSKAVILMNRPQATRILAKKKRILDRRQTLIYFYQKEAAINSFAEFLVDFRGNAAYAWKETERIISTNITFFLQQSQMFSAD